MISSIIFKFSDFDWTATIAAATALLALFFSLYVYHKDNKNKSSQFFLEQSKTYFTEGANAIKVAKYSYLKWSNAIELLLIGHCLCYKITNKNHQVIYMTEYRKATYEILEEIIKIDDFRFFYGVADYKKYDSSILRHGNFPKIDPERLLSLCIFLDKADSENYDSLDSNKIYKNKYFQKKITDSKQVSKKMQTNAGRIIFQYIENEAIKNF